MARIRTVKPGFFTSLPVASVSPRARLLFVGLFTHVDDDGRAVYEPRLIKAAVFPLDDDITASDVASDLEALERAGLVSLYTVDGRRYLLVVGFLEHQVINKPSPSKLPAPPSSKAPEVPGTAPVVLPESYSPEGKGREGNGKDSSAAAGGWPASVAASWTRQIGPRSYGQVGRQLKPFADQCASPADAERAMLAAVDNFAKHRRLAMERGIEKPDNWPQFVRDLLDYVPPSLKPKREAA